MSRGFFIPALFGSSVLAVPAVLLVFGSAHAAAGFARQAPARDQPPIQVQEQPSGSGRIAVLVVAAENGAPVKRVRVMLNGMIMPPRPPAGAPQGPAAVISSVAVSPQGQVVTGFAPGAPAMPGRVQKEGETDETGRVEFASLPAASYSVMAMPATGFVRPAQSESLQLRDGEQASLTIRLMRGGAITGHVVDESGDPLSRAAVRAIRKDAGLGLPRFASAGTSGTTDDRGQYRIYDLPPGDYFVVATVFNQSMSWLPGNPPGELKMGYLPTYYPGVGNMDGARAVNVKPAQDAAGIDFFMLRGRLGRVVGTATDSTGAPLSSRSSSVTLTPKAREQANVTRSGGMVRPDGTFMIPDVPPGDYYLSAYALRTEPVPGVPINPSDREGAFIPVTVNGEEVAVNIQTNTGATLSGRVLREGPMPPPSLVPGVAPRMPPPQAMRVTVGVRPPPPTSSPLSPAFASGKAEYSEEDGTFTLTGVRGSVLLTASSGVGVVKAIRRGASDLLGVPLELTGTERIDDLEVVLTTDIGSLSGTVTDARGQPAAGAWVLVFTDDPKRWFAPFVSIGRAATAVPAGAASAAPQPGSLPGVSPSVSAGQPGARTLPRAPGQYTVPRLLPGRYLAVALEGTGNSFPSPEPDLIESLRPKAVRVTIQSGEMTTLELKVGK